MVYCLVRPCNQCYPRCRRRGARRLDASTYKDYLAVLNPRRVDRCPMKQRVRGRLLNVTITREEIGSGIVVGRAFASSIGATSRDLGGMETRMQEDEYYGGLWLKKALQQAKVAKTIHAMEAETRAQGTPLGETGRFTHGALTPEDEGELRYAVTTSGGKVILAFGTPVEWIGMTPRMAHQLADALNKWASET